MDILFIKCWRFGVWGLGLCLVGVGFDVVVGDVVCCWFYFVVLIEFLFCCFVFCWFCGFDYVVYFLIVDILCDLLAVWVVCYVGCWLL